MTSTNRNGASAQAGLHRHTPPHVPVREHSVPWFWPLAATIELAELGASQLRDNLKFVAEVERISAPPPPKWATSNEVHLDLDTMRLRIGIVRD